MTARTEKRLAEVQAAELFAGRVFTGMDAPTCPRTYAGRVRLLEARGRLAGGVAPVRARRRLRWWPWLLMAVPVAVAAVWRFAQ